MMMAALFCDVCCHVARQAQGDVPIDSELCHVGGGGGPPQDCYSVCSLNGWWKIETREDSNSPTEEWEYRLCKV
jgi:hypothetical protein